LAFVFNKALWGVGSVAEGRRQRAARIAGIARHRRHRAGSGKAKPLTTKDTKEHKGDCQNRRNCQNRVIAKIEKQNLAMVKGKDKLKSREIADNARDREKQNR